MPYRYLKRHTDSSYFHVYNRGNNKESLFLTPVDYQRFIDNIQKYSELENVRVVSYCLMRNHYHLLLKEMEAGAIARLMQRLNVAYAMYFNPKYKHIGHLFQGPYGEREIDSDGYLVQASAYIHNNPHHIGRDIETYPWSSYQDYLSGRNSWLIKDVILDYFPEANKVGAYQNFVQSAQDLVLNERARPGLETVML